MPCYLVGWFGELLYLSSKKTLFEGIAKGGV